VLKSVLADPASLERVLDTIMGPPLPVVGADEPADVVTRLLASRNAAVLVKSDGAVSGILTRFDMLQFIAGGES
jgi:predicted transcriptional regulator